MTIRYIGRCFAISLRSTLHIILRSLKRLLLTSRLQATGWEQLLFPERLMFRSTSSPVTMIPATRLTVRVFKDVTLQIRIFRGISWRGDTIVSATGISQTAAQRNLFSTVRKILRYGAGRRSYHHIACYSKAVRFRRFRRAYKAHSHLLNYGGPHEVPSIRTYNEIPKLGPLTVTISDAISPKSVTIEPEHKAWTGNKHKIVIDSLEIHTVIAVEL